ncbi:MAG: hypothetical protein ACOC12_06340, partial [Bacteroidota bacterium]
MKKQTILTLLISLALNIYFLSVNTVAQSDTTTVKRLMEEGISRMENNELRKAIELFDQGREMLHKIAVEKSEKNQDIIRSNQLTRDAEKLIRQNNLEQALGLLNEAIELNDQNIEALKFRGSIRLILEQQKERPKDRDFIGLNNDYTNA